MKNKKVIISIVILALLVGYIKGCAYLPISGTVVDAENGKPIEGAVVLAEWTIKKGGMVDHHTESVKVAEVLTDKDGKFELPGCYRPFVEASDLTIYKKGYVAWNNKYIFPTFEKRTDFQWKSGNVLKLQGFNKKYSFVQHQSFIDMTASLSSANTEKRLFMKAYEEGEGKDVLMERNKK